MISLEELKAIQANMQNEMGIRNDDREAGKIVVGMGTEGIAAGAKDIVLAFVECLGKKGIFNVAVIQDGNFVCTDRAPVAEVYIGNAEKVTYVNLTPEKVARIVDEHVVGGKVVAEYTVGTTK